MNYLDTLVALEAAIAAVDLSAAGDLAPVGEGVRFALERCTALVRSADAELRPWLASWGPTSIPSVHTAVESEHTRRPGEPYDLWRWRLEGQVSLASVEALRLAVYDRAAPFRTPGVTAAFSVLDRRAAFDAAIRHHQPHGSPKSNTKGSPARAVGDKGIHKNGPPT